MHCLCKIYNVNRKPIMMKVVWLNILSNAHYWFKHFQLDFRYKLQLTKLSFLFVFLIINVLIHFSNTIIVILEFKILEFIVYQMFMFIFYTNLQSNGVFITKNKLYNNLIHNEIYLALHKDCNEHIFFHISALCPLSHIKC